MIRAIIADDSAFMRQVLKDVLEEKGDVTVVAAAKNGKEAVELVKQHKPQILILDVEMPVMNGLEALRTIMKESPLPVFMFSSLTREGATVTIKALEYGAVDFLLKPLGGAHSLGDVADELIAKIKMVAQKSFYKRLGPGTGQGAVATPRVPGSGAPSTAAPVERPARAPLSRRTIELIAMGSSTGGVQAALEVVPLLAKESKPIVWVQHMPANFTKSFANRLDGVSKMRVKEAENGDIVENGVCYLAAGGVQMRLQQIGGKYKLVLNGTEKVSGHCPSCNVLFDSVAQYFSSNVLGVILTGMGDDGTEGLKKMHDKGAYVIGQNEASCVVYGMPRAAYQAGAVDIELDIKSIADGISKVTGI